MIHANNVNKFNIISSYGYHKIFNQDVVSLSVSQSVSHSLENMIWQILELLVGSIMHLKVKQARLKLEP